MAFALTAQHSKISRDTWSQSLEARTITSEWMTRIKVRSAECCNILGKNLRLQDRWQQKTNVPFQRMLPSVQVWEVVLHCNQPLQQLPSTSFRNEAPPLSSLAAQKCFTTKYFWPKNSSQSYCSIGLLKLRRNKRNSLQKPNTGLKI